MSEDRPKRDWRDVDRNKDRSAHRKEERPGLGGPARPERRQSAYRSKLDQLFDSGRIGSLVKGQEEQQEAKEAEEHNPGRIKLLRGIAAAEGRDAITKAVDAYLAEHDVPDDFDALTKMLEHRNPSRHLDAMEHLDRLLEQEQRPRRTASLLSQLRMVRDMSDERDAKELAERLIAKLT